VPVVTSRTTTAAQLAAASLEELLAGGVGTPERWRAAAQKALKALCDAGDNEPAPQLLDAIRLLLIAAPSAGIPSSEPEVVLFRRHIESTWRKRAIKVPLLPEKSGVLAFLKSQPPGSKLRIELPPPPPKH